MSGRLHIVPTPVGNLEDMTYRAVRVLQEADLILAEDTRTSSVLLHHYGITGKVQSHHKFNEHATVQLIKEKILAGQDVALISDADSGNVMLVIPFLSKKQPLPIALIPSGRMTDLRFTLNEDKTPSSICMA